jgi:hypothetical protein
MKFLLTKELGRLAKWLRILGFDARYSQEVKSATLIIEALREGRQIITRNHHLPKPKGQKIIILESEKIQEQLPEVLKALKISADSAKMFTRCIVCNAELIDIEKESVKGKVPEYVYQTQEDFLACPQCKRIYWQGTHWGNVQQIMKEIK